ncbi:uncharacterized protein LOC143629343 [Bidens hawaiensis]|uniref:uncharacterized protein LOC143629343 n=1 Tax=Bidens hawaiensis TaxID=980011 RepID=UPI00404AA1BD
MGGGNFTYISDKGEKFSKLDRVLVCKDFMGRWPLASLTLLAKDCSDHRPILLASVASDFGHILFLFFNSWLDLTGFEDFVVKQCSRFRFEGPAELALSTKLRMGGIKKKKETVQKLELEGESRSLTNSELELRADCLDFVKEFESIKYRDLKQKTRVRWAVDGDENSKYFHSVINANLSSNRLQGLRINGEWVSSPTLIKEFAV